LLLEGSTYSRQNKWLRLVAETLNAVTAYSISGFCLFEMTI
jgi:hypothetical protein